MPSTRRLIKLVLEGNAPYQTFAKRCLAVSTLSFGRGLGLVVSGRRGIL